MFQHQRYRFFAFTALSQYSSRHAIGSPIQFVIGDLLISIPDGKTIRVSGYLLLEAFGYGLLDLLHSKLDKVTRWMHTSGLNVSMVGKIGFALRP